MLDAFEDEFDSMRTDRDIARAIVLESILDFGSRSLSHLLNILEKHAELLKDLAAEDSKNIFLETLHYSWHAYPTVTAFSS